MIFMCVPGSIRTFDLGVLGRRVVSRDIRGAASNMFEKLLLWLHLNFCKFVHRVYNFLCYYFLYPYTLFAMNVYWFENE